MRVARILLQPRIMRNTSLPEAFMAQLIASHSETERGQLFKRAYFSKIPTSFFILGLWPSTICYPGQSSDRYKTPINEMKVQKTKIVCRASIDTV